MIGHALNFTPLKEAQGESGEESKQERRGTAGAR